MWNVSAVSPSPQRMRGFTSGRFHNLQRMMRVAVWMRRASADDRLEQLIDLFNAEHLLGLSAAAGPVLQYQRLRVAVPADFICSAVHSDSDNRNSLLYRSLREHLSWSDKAEVTDNTIAYFVLHLKRTFFWPRVWGTDIAVPGSLHVADADHIPQPRAAGAWRCDVALCLASLTRCILRPPTHDSCHVARYRVRVILMCSSSRLQHRTHARGWRCHCWGCGWGCGSACGCACGCRRSWCVTISPCSAPIAPSYRSRACGAGGLVAVVAAVWSL